MSHEQAVAIRIAVIAARCEARSIGRDFAYIGEKPRREILTLKGRK